MLQKRACIWLDCDAECSSTSLPGTVFHTNGKRHWLHPNEARASRDNDRNRTRLILTPGNVFAWLLSRASSSSGSSRCCAGFLILHGESERPGRLCPCAVVSSCSHSCAAGCNYAGLCTIAASPLRPVILSHRPPSAERDVLVGAIATFRLLAIINN